MSSDFHRQPRVADIESPLSTGRIGRTNPPSEAPVIARRVGPAPASCARAVVASSTHAASESVAPAPIARSWLFRMRTAGRIPNRERSLRGSEAVDASIGKAGAHERHDTGERSCGPASRASAVAAKIATASPPIHAAATGSPAAKSHDAATSAFQRLP